MHHISGLARVGAKNVLFDLLDFLGGKCNYDWIEARKVLSQYVNRWHDGSDALRQEYLEMLENLRQRISTIN